MFKRIFQFNSIMPALILFIIAIFIGNDVSAKFTDVTVAAGLGQRGTSYGNPVWGDFNNDGLIDLIVPRHARTPSLYKNNGAGQFVDIINISGITPLIYKDRHGWVWGDYDNDGKLDLHVSNGGCRGTCLNTPKDELWKGDGQGGFVNTAQIAGVTNPIGRGRANFWVDYNNDGLLDIFVLNTNSNSIMFKNNGDGTFSDVTLAVGLFNISGDNCSWADYNNDGTIDLLITGGANDRLFKNSFPQFTFTDVTLQAGLLPKKGFGISWGDYNNDGYQDLYITRGHDFIINSLIWNPTKIVFGDEERWDDGIDFSTTGNNVTFNLYINNRASSTNVFLGSGKIKPLSNPFTISLSDPLLNGIPTYLAGTNTGIFIWKDVNGILHLRYSGDINFPSYYGIITSDGNFTTVTSTFKPLNYKHKDTLYRNNGNGTFTDITDIVKVGKSGNHTAAIWGDYNNDGFVDLYIIENGDVTGGKPSILYKNTGIGTFLNVAVSQGVDAVNVIGRKYGAAFGDYNNDGYLDIFVKNSLRTFYYPRSMGPDILYRNDNNGNGNHWLKVTLIGTTSNKLGLGAKLTLFANGKMQYREHNGGGGGELRSQGNLPIHFGTGSSTIVDSLTIKWPSGRQQTLINIPVDQTVTVIEN